MTISIKTGVFGATLLASVPLFLLATPATARDCSGDDVYKIYEQATSKGHEDAQDHEDSRAHHHYRHMHLSHGQERCYKQGYERCWSKHR